MTRIACTVMQKNEDALLGPWLTYHGDLFGFENLFVFDNGSTSPHVLQTLEAFAALGVVVDATYSTHADYVRKGEITACCIRMLQDQGRHHMVFALDCDEFIVLKDGSVATADPGRLLDHAERIRDGHPALLRVDTQFFNVIDRPGRFGRTACAKTAIVLDGTFLTSDHGHHQCTTTAGSTYRSSDFAYVHYHYKPLPMLQAHARAKLAPFVDLSDPHLTESFRGTGCHLRPYLTMTEEMFHNWHLGDDVFHFTEFNDRLAALGSPIPF